LGDAEKLTQLSTALLRRHTIQKHTQHEISRELVGSKMGALKKLRVQLKKGSSRDAEVPLKLIIPHHRTALPVRFIERMKMRYIMGGRLSVHLQCSQCGQIELYSCIAAAIILVQVGYDVVEEQRKCESARLQSKLCHSNECGGVTISNERGEGDRRGGVGRRRDAEQLSRPRLEETAAREGEGEREA